MLSGYVRARFNLKAGDSAPADTCARCGRRATAFEAVDWATDDDHDHVCHRCVEKGALEQHIPMAVNRRTSEWENVT